MPISASSVDPRMNTRNRLLDRNTRTRINKGFGDLGLDQRIKLWPFRWKRRDKVEIAGGGF